MSRLRAFEFRGRTAVLTGAAGGIGAQVARALAARGTHLVLLDRDEEGLEKLVADLGNDHPDLRLETHVVDLADRDATEALAQRIAAGHPRLDLLVNNAGVALGGRFESLTLEEFDWLMQINFHAAVQLTHHLLPSLVAAPGSHIANVSSIFGIIAPDGQSAYAASKFALRGFSESLRAELAPRQVGVTSVHPGGIRTQVGVNARIGEGMSAAEAERLQRECRALLTIAPEVAAEAIVTGIERRRRRVLIGLTAYAPDVLARLFPTRYHRAYRLYVDALTAVKGGRA